MANIIPFKAIRPTPDKVHLVATRSYVSYSPAALKRKLAENPFSFIHVINPEYGLNHHPLSGSERFPLVRERYLQFIDDGILVQDQQPAFYVYRQIQPHDSFTGIIAGISIDDYLCGTIRVHEQTLTRREKLFKEYLDVCNFNAEPVLLTYADNQSVDEIINQTTRTRPEYDFSTTDYLRHQLWAITDPNEIATISRQFESMDKIYIADGHHRSASSSLLGVERRKNNPHHRGDEMYNYLMACLISESQLKILDYNRVVKDINGYSPEGFLDLLKLDFEVEALKEPVAPSRLHQFTMFLDNQWYLLDLKNPPQEKSPAEHLDAQILSERILQKHLGIYDLKADSRIEFISGKVGLDGLKLYADKKGMELGFALYPVTTSQLKAVADADQIMPPKTTWIEPKLRSGLTILSFDE